MNRNIYSLDSTFSRFADRVGLFCLGLFKCFVFLGIGSPATLLGQSVEYSIGEPSAEEQLSLELINRARANPTAEGVRLAAQATSQASVKSDVTAFNTNLTTMKSEMAALSPQPPLSFNAILMDAARTHSNNMLASNSQTHYSTSSSKHYWNRMDDMGYVWSAAGENIFASANDVEEAHASFEIDWGSGSSGMQSGRGHRLRIHSGEHREIGIGWVLGTKSSVGPALITQDFGERISRSTIKPYITGVAIYDADGDDFYDIGEGIENVKVTVVDVSTGATEDHFAMTSSSGGYSVPVDGGAGDYEVTFEMPDGEAHVFTVAVTSEIQTQYTPDWERGFNVKLDLILQEGDPRGYAPPAFESAMQVAEDATTILDFSPVVGASQYEVLVAARIDSPAELDAETPGPVSSSKSSSYALVGVPSSQGDRKAFHLAHPSSSSGHQSMTIERVFVPGDNGELYFSSRLRNTGTAQIAVVQVTANEGRTWTDVWFDQNNFSTADSLTEERVDVSEFAGQPIKFRFLFYLGGGSVSYNTSSFRGWHFDDIGFDDMVELLNSNTSSVSASEFAFTPPEAGDYHLQVRAKAGADFLRYATASSISTAVNNFSGWVARKEAEAGLPAGALGDSGSDYDGDGLPQIAEYALESLGFDPAVYDATSLPAAVIEGEELCFHYSVDTSLSDVEVYVEVSSDLVNWYTPAESGAPVGFSDTAVGSPVGTQQVRTAAVPVAGHEGLYMRLRVNELP